MDSKVIIQTDTQQQYKMGCKTLRNTAFGSIWYQNSKVVLPNHEIILALKNNSFQDRPSWHLKCQQVAIRGLWPTLIKKAKEKQPPETLSFKNEVWKIKLFTIL